MHDRAQLAESTLRPEYQVEGRESDLGLDVDTYGEDGDKDWLDNKALGRNLDAVRCDDSKGGGNIDSGGERGNACKAMTHLQDTMTSSRLTARQTALHL